MLRRRARKKTDTMRRSLRMAPGKVRRKQRRELCHSPSASVIVLFFDLF